MRASAVAALGNAIALGSLSGTVVVARTGRRVPAGHLRPYAYGLRLGRILGPGRGVRRPREARAVIARSFLVIIFGLLPGRAAVSAASVPAGARPAETGIDAGRNLIGQLPWGSS